VVIDTYSADEADYDEHLLMMAFNNMDNEQILEFIDDQENWRSIRLSEDKESLLHIGIFSKNFSICKAILKRNMDPNCKNKEGHTALHSATMEKGTCKYVDLLMKHNSDPTIKDNHGKTPLHYNHCITCLSIIVKEYKINQKDAKAKTDNILDIQDNDGNTCLLQAILDLVEGSSKLNLVKEMVKLDADFTIQNHDGDNALLLAAKIPNPDLLGMLGKFFNLQYTNTNFLQ
jgi:ankyrin repeat protein